MSDKMVKCERRSARRACAVIIASALAVPVVGVLFVLSGGLDAKGKRLFQRIVQREMSWGKVHDLNPILSDRDGNLTFIDSDWNMMALIIIARDQDYSNEFSFFGGTDRALLMAGTAHQVDVVAQQDTLVIAIRGQTTTFGLTPGIVGEHFFHNRDENVIKELLRLDACTEPERLRDFAIENDILPAEVGEEPRRDGKNGEAVSPVSPGSTAQRAHPGILCPHTHHQPQPGLHNTSHALSSYAGVEPCQGS